MTGTPFDPAQFRVSLADVLDVGNPHHFLAGGQGALPQNSQGRPWNGDYVFSSGDLVEDLTHNFFLETGARNNKLKVYEMVEHPAARALTARHRATTVLHDVDVRVGAGDDHAHRIIQIRITHLGIDINLLDISVLAVGGNWGGFVCHLFLFNKGSRHKKDTKDEFL